MTKSTGSGAGSTGPVEIMSEAAFPSNIDGVNNHGSPGMTLRDWFAGQALAGLSSAVLALPDATTRDVSGDAYKLADAMLAERKREQSA